VAAAATPFEMRTLMAQVRQIALHEPARIVVIWLPLFEQMFAVKRVYRALEFV
jgi:hypothetical protein